MTPMRRTPVVLGTLNVIFGSLVSMYYVIGIVMQSSIKGWTETFSKMMAMAPHRPGTPDPAAMMEGMMQALEKLKPWQHLMSGGMALLSLACIGVGYGLIKRQPWSRQASVIWSVAALAFIPVMIYVQVAIIFPTVNQIMMDSMKGIGGGGLRGGAFMMDAMSSMQSTMTVIFTIAFYAPYPIILGALMGRSSAKNDLNPA